MGRWREDATPGNSDEESGDAFTDGDFGDSDEDVVESPDGVKSCVPVNETVNMDVKNADATNGVSNDNEFEFNGSTDEPKVNGLTNGQSCDLESLNGEVMPDIRRDSHGDQNPSIVGILGDQQNHVCICTVFEYYIHVLKLRFCSVCHMRLFLVYF